VNGSFVDGKKLNPNQMVMLRKGQQIIFGEMTDPVTVNGTLPLFDLKPRKNNRF
jgi:hypothetical protein